MLTNFFDTIKNITDAFNEGGGGKKKKDPLPSQDYLEKFGNWANTTDTKAMAKDLMNRGLIGADQIYFSKPDPNDPNSIRNNQADWKLAAIRNVLMNARKFNIQNPAAVMANKDLLIGNPRWADAINNQYFKNIHPNFWPVVNQILADRYKQFQPDLSQTNNTNYANSNNP